MQTVSNAWKTMQTKNLLPPSKIQLYYEITADDVIGDIKSISANDYNIFYSGTSQIVGNPDATFERYITTERNFTFLDGTFKAFGYNYRGYISNVQSNSSSIFSGTVPQITITFNNVQTSTLPGLMITWSSAFQEYPKSFSVKTYNGSTLVHEETVSNNTDVTSVLSFSLTGYDKIVIRIADWCLPGRFARLEQVFIGTRAVFTEKNIISFEHNQSVDLLSFNLPKAEIDFTIDNVDEKFNPDNPQGLYQYLSERQKIKARYGYIVNGSVEWLKCGTFFLEEWDIPQNGITAQFKARDLITFIDKPFVYGWNGVNLPTLYDIAVMAFSQCNLPSAYGATPYNVDVSLQAITNISWDNEWNYTCAQVVQLCANAAQCVFYQDRDGILQITPFSPSSATLTDYEINRFVSLGGDANYEISKTLLSVDVNSGLGTASTGNSAGEIQTISNPLIQTAEVAGAVATWTKDILVNRRQLNGDIRPDIRADALDYITVVNKYATQTLFLTELKYKYNGAFKGSYKGRVI